MARFRKNTHRSKSIPVQRTNDNIDKWIINCRELYGCQALDDLECQSICDTPGRFCWVHPNTDIAIPGFTTLENTPLANGKNILTETCIPINQVNDDLLSGD